jgi:hypothetical protein
METAMGGARKLYITDQLVLEGTKPVGVNKKDHTVKATLKNSIRMHTFLIVSFSYF